jgi:pilus assembly protein CpaF
MVIEFINLTKNYSVSHLDRALEFRLQIYPVLEDLLNSQNNSFKAKELQKNLDDFSLDRNYNVEALYSEKARKAKILSLFIEEIFSRPQEFNLFFSKAPSIVDKKWTIQLLVYDFLYYGPITILSVASILKKTNNLDEDPYYQLLTRDLDHKQITEIRVNNYEQIFYEAINRIFEWPVPFISNSQLEIIIQRIISEANLLYQANTRLNSSVPIADFEHPCGYIRGSAVISPAAAEPFLTLRIHPGKSYSLDDLMDFGMFSKEIKDFFIALQRAGTTIAIAGTMGSGKTTLLSALAECWPDKGRKATIEDTPELKPNIKDLIKLRTIEFDNDSVKNIDVTRLTKACKRHSVRYVVLSEARDGSAWEILQLSQAILGCLMTYHYTLRSDRFLVDQALNTLVALAKQNQLAPQGDDIKHLIASMVQILVLVEQSPHDNVRRIVKVYFITGFDEMNGGHFKFVELFSYDESKGFHQVIKSVELEDYLRLKGVNYRF